jgi:hypothetical protein
VHSGANAAEKEIDSAAEQQKQCAHRAGSMLETWDPFSMTRNWLAMSRGVWEAMTGR